MSAVEQEAKIKDLQAKLQNFDNPTPQPSNSGILKSLLSELYVEGSLWLTLDQLPMAMIVTRAMTMMKARVQRAKKSRPLVWLERAPFATKAITLKELNCLSHFKWYERGGWHKKVQALLLSYYSCTRLTKRTWLIVHFCVRERVTCLYCEPASGDVNIRG